MMKRNILLGLCLSLCMGAMAQQQGVTLKRGKATMSETYYNELKQKADQCEQLQKELANTQAKLKDATQKKTVELRTFNDSASYAIGHDILTSWNQQQLGINGSLAAQAMIDMTNGEYTMPERTTRALLQRFQNNFEQRQHQKEEQMKASTDDNIAAGKKFLTENQKSKAIHTTASGLQYKILKQGEGKKPTASSTVKVHYTGTLIDGTKFDSSIDRGEPIEFPLNAVIPGWTEGLQLMNEGSKYILYIPYNLGYGTNVVGSIPPGSTLIFEVELIEVK